MTVYYCRALFTCASGAQIYHRFNISAASLSEAQTKAAALMDWYQPITNAQVSKLLVGGVDTPFSVLRAQPAGVMTRRLIITCLASTSYPVNRAVIRLAITDPLKGIVDWLNGITQDPPQEWSNFKSNFLTQITTVHGEPFREISRLSFSDHGRVADLDAPSGKRPWSGRFDDFVMVHATTHLHGGLDPIVYVKRVLRPASEFAVVGMGTSNGAQLYARGFSASSDTYLYTLFYLDDYNGGDIVLTMWYFLDFVATGNEVFKLEYSAYGAGDTQTVQKTQTKTFAAPGDTKLHNDRTFTIPASDVSRGKVLAVKLHRLGADAGDTQNTSQTEIFALEAKYNADLPQA